MAVLLNSASSEDKIETGTRTDVAARSDCPPTLLIQHNVTSLKRSVDDLDSIILTSSLLTILVGTAGNIFVIYVILSFRRRHQRKVAQSTTATNDYILNLSVADLAFVLTLPFFCYATVQGHWPFGDAACRLTYAVRETNCFASVYTLVALSVDRYFASFARSRGPHDLRTKRITRLTCAAIWLACGLITTPYFLYAKVVDQPSQLSNRSLCLTMGGRPRTLLATSTQQSPMLLPSLPRQICRFEWPGNQIHYKVGWTCFQLIFALVVPFTIIFTSYALLTRRLCTRLDRQGGSALLRRPCRQTTRTVVVIGLTFLVCYVPYHVVRVLVLRNMVTTRDRGPGYLPDEGEYRAFVYLNFIAQVLVFVASCCNPIIYGLFNANYRKQYKNSLLCCSKSSRLTRDSTRERRGLIGQSTEERQLQLSCHVIVKLTSPSCDVSSKHGGNCCSLPITPPTELLTRDTSGPFNLFHDDSCLSTWV